MVTVRRYLILLTTVALIAMPSLGGSASAAKCSGTTIGVGINGVHCVPGNGKTELENYIHLLVVWANGVITILAVLMIMYGGVKYVYSMGNPDQIKDAKSTIIGALAGVFLLIIADVLLLAINPTLVGPVGKIFGSGG
jgi:uncharacterized membrane protein